MLTDRWTDVGHINLTGGLVTCNPPKNIATAIKYVYPYPLTMQVDMK